MPLAALHIAVLSHLARNIDCFYADAWYSGKLNYIDWESELVQARASCEVIRKHGKLAVVMEPVKGGGTDWRKLL